jgi:hypothetical protein
VANRDHVAEKKVVRDCEVLGRYVGSNENLVLITTIPTVAAVYDRRGSVSGDIPGGHRPPLQ